MRQNGQLVHQGLFHAECTSKGDKTGDVYKRQGEEFAQELIDYTDKIYLEFGADPHVEGIYTGEDIKEIRKNAIHAGLKLVDCPCLLYTSRCV